MPKLKDDRNVLQRIGDSVNEGIAYYGGPHLNNALHSLTELAGYTDAGDAQAAAETNLEQSQDFDPWRIPEQIATNAAVVIPGVSAKMFRKTKPAAKQTVTKPSPAAPAGSRRAKILAERAQASTVNAAKGTKQTLPAAPKKAIAIAPTGGEELFDYSQLHKVPDVPQVDLPRNIPARGVPERVVDVTRSKSVRDRMLQLVQKGVEKGGPNWYNAEPLRVEFIRELGREKGDAMFGKFMDYVAATSPRSDVPTNVRNASFYYARDVKGQPLPQVGDKNPQPYGHMAQRLHQMNAQRVINGGIDPLNNPKPASFAANLKGNQKPATIDTHAFRAPAILAQDPRFLETGFDTGVPGAPRQNIRQMVEKGKMKVSDARPAHWQSKPKDNEYAAMEAYYGMLGRELGLTPAQTQASAWVGAGDITGLGSDESKPFLRFVEDRVNKTAQALSMEPREVLGRFIRGEMPLLSVAGAAGGVLWMRQLRDAAQQQQEPADQRG